MTLLTDAEAAEFWNERHQRESDLRSGGHISFDEATNHMFYMRRLALLMDLVGLQSSPAAPLFLLDAGCGKGWFARSMARFGHSVDAIDASPAAIEACRAAAPDTPGRTPSYAVSTLSGWAPACLYDVVYSVDVLFHILDDAEWAASVRSLAGLVRLGGTLAVSDWDVPEARVLGNYQVVRSRPQYDALLGQRGLTRTGFVPDGFRGSPVGFHVFRRTG
jgi:2-polyprenyl-3-methyl-5-hydroxy-6-metoxy-1,4-benzoquinol methylase